MSDEGISPVANVVFGCAHDNDGYNGQPSGILGLGPSNISLATQLGSKFSYCIGSIKDPKYPHNQLILGDGAKIEGLSTPLEVYNDLYYLTLGGISLSERRLEIDPEIFKRTPSGTGGTVFDSGTTLSFLAKDGDELGLDIESLFQEYGQNEFCMALQDSPVGNDLNVVGIMAQQFYNVAYDLAANKVYFQRIDCELLDD
ncbi:PREDICTED: aspartic [Prunus dulcis]|uniref:PREDICTED: aspartic n=1 Tax=Prunus dulcis TaxID=3755 RepID=A0A5E4FLX9_PRUDU|nr:PREDICTED: aspartic [Prunus dulcis]